MPSCCNRDYFTETCTYMDSAYDCGGSQIGRDAAVRYFDEWALASATAKRGGPGREPFFRVADETREYLGKLLGGVPARNVTITKNTNEGINIILQGFDFQAGDNIVTFDREYSSNVMACIHASAIRGIECRFARMDENFNPSVDRIWEKVDEHTVMILVSHVQSLTGYKINLEELGRRCREKGIFLVVDAVQSMGFNAFRAEEWGVSAVSGAGYKGLGAFISIGYLYCCDDLLMRVHPIYVSDSFHLSLDLGNDIPCINYGTPLDAGKFDNCSSDYLGTYIFHDSIQKILEIGIDRIEARIRGLFDMLYTGLAEQGYQLITPAEEEHHCASICFRTEHADDIYRYFINCNVILSCSRQRFIRISLGAYSNEEDVERTLEVATQCPWR